MWLLPASMDPLYGPVAREYGRFRLRRRFIPLRDFQALPTGADEITVLDDTGTEVAVVGISRHGSDLQAVAHHLNRWLSSEASRLVHLEVDTRRQRREVGAAGVEDGTPGAGPRDWTVERWDAFYASQQERARPMLGEIEPRLRGRGLSLERTREYVDRLIREVGEEPDPKASVVPWWRLSLDERYQRYELVERGLYELAAAHPELGDEPSEGASESSHR